MGDPGPVVLRRLSNAEYNYTISDLTGLDLDPTREFPIDGAAGEGLLLIMAVGNGRQCGGGYQVTPHALLNDGLLDVVAIHDAEVPQLGLVLSELLDLRAKSNQFVTYRQVSSFSLESSRPLQLNLDGESYLDTSRTLSTTSIVTVAVSEVKSPLRT